MSTTPHEITSSSEAARTMPTMADVAALAGVSHQTVSRVLNNPPAVSAVTRRKVQEAITTLGYRRNLAARTLVTGNSRIIGVLVSTTVLSGPTGAMLAIEQSARANGYWVSMASMKTQATHEVGEIVSHFVDQGVDGIIAVAQTQVALDATLEASAGRQTVLVTSGHVPPSVSSVEIAQHEGARQAMTILKGLGHTRIAHISGPPYDLHAGARAQVWKESLEDPEANLLVEGDWTPQSGYYAAMSLLSLSKPPTAIFAANDQMAFGVLRALNERGMKVPLDMSVVGFDDIEGADCSIPPLTTIRQDNQVLGVAAMDLLLEAIHGLPARQMTIPTHAVIRSSTAAPSH
ncbi:MAG: LacI family transcriptional regulator [Propionibacteriaceae bacterium]|nr:LacI family transcriptional regulator [Propionibacteriaceae bacterium]